MTDAAGDNDADTSKSFVKDLDNIRRQDFLLQVDLEDPDVAREHWIGLRSKTLERFGLALMPTGTKWCPNSGSVFVSRSISSSGRRTYNLLISVTY